MGGYALHFTRTHTHSVVCCGVGCCALQFRPPSHTHTHTHTTHTHNTHTLIHTHPQALLEHDARAYPLPRDERGGKRDKKRGGGPAAAEGPPLARYDAEELGAAAGLVAAEVEFVRQAMGHGGVSQEEYSDAWAAAARDAVWLPASKRYGRAAAAAPAERADSLRAEFDALRGQMEREAHRAAKLEKKAGVVIAGLQQRDAKQRSLVDELAQALADARAELACFSALQARELRAAPDRAAAGRALVAAQREREAELQARYRELGARRDELLEALRGGARAAAAAAAAGG
ncbi:MAG: hypothetical protein J3K34DRAFT_135029 [Monoraphidium minutum]|nr:MAG: hypothetical protein J3K34DRAFT_135029 [Monoraphidium minutum]